MAFSQNKHPAGFGEGRRAVVDIGSNSVRLVIYDGPPRAPLAICNEKALCGLGRDMTDDGRLNPASVEDAKSTLIRFRQLIREYGDPPTFAIATAAVRAAKDGADFVKQVAKIGFDVSVITGAEEAALAALGVVSFEPDATGIAGDMGGGSLELICLNKGELADSVSLQVGPLSIMRKVGDDLAAAKALIEEEISKVDFLTDYSGGVLYSVGGAWRAIARIHMRVRSYPLSVLHHYEMSSAEALNTCALIARQSRQSLEEIPGIPRRRIDTLPYASLVMTSVLKRMKAKRVVVSAGGVREGLLYRALSEEERKADPLLAACAFFAQRLSPNPAFGETALKVIEPLFGDDGKSRLRQAASLLIDIGAFFHPDMRGKFAFDTAMDAPFVGLSHPDRVWLALALYRRYQGKSAPLPNEESIGLLAEDDQVNATRFGLAMRFAASFAPKISAPLEGCSLTYAPSKDGEPEKVVFKAPPDRRAMMGDSPRKRLDHLAAAFDAIPVECYE